MQDERDLEQGLALPAANEVGGGGGGGGGGGDGGGAVHAAGELPALGGLPQWLREAVVEEARADAVEGPHAPGVGVARQVRHTERTLAVLRAVPFIMLLLLTVLVEHLDGLFVLVVVHFNLTKAEAQLDAYRASLVRPTVDGMQTAKLWGVMVLAAVNALWLQFNHGSMLWGHLALEWPGAEPVESDADADGVEVGNGLEEGYSLFETMWRVILVDLIIRSGAAVLEACVYLLTQSRTHAADDDASGSGSMLARKLVACVRSLSVCYRTCTPVPLWLFYFGTVHLHIEFFREVLVVSYLFFKTRSVIVFVQTYHVFVNAISTKAPFGRYINVGVGPGHRRRDIEAAEAPEPDDDEDDTCPICYSEFEERAIELDCKHRFCEKCICSWVDQAKNSCPICRAPIVMGGVSLSGGAAGGALDGGGNGNNNHAGVPQLERLRSMWNVTSSRLPVGLNVNQVILF